MVFFTIFILSLFLTIALIPVLKRMAFRMKIVDMPDDRKVHVNPMPKTGGISMAFGALIPFLIWVPKDNFSSGVLVGSVILVAFGLLDDIKTLSSKQKVLPQIVAALIVVLWGGVRIKTPGLFYPGLEFPGPVSILLTLFVIVGVTNAINLADGLDGLAGGISMLSFAVIGFLAFRCENFVVAMMAVGAVMGFLRYNTYPAILFMGDAGSQLLGFLSIVFAIVITQTNTPYSKILSLPLIGFPIFDTIMVIINRMAKGRSPFMADKKHFHHRLLRIGFFHSEAVLGIYIIQACFLSFSLVFRFYPGWIHVLFYIIFSSIVVGAVSLADKKDRLIDRETGRLADIKAGLKVYKEKKVFIRMVYGLLRYSVPLLLLFQCLSPAVIPKYFGLIALILISMIAGTIFIFRDYSVFILRLSVYLIVPLVLYLGATDSCPWMTPWICELNNYAFVLMVALALVTMRLTMRQQGFKITPMDILVFILLLVFPNLPETHVQAAEFGATIAKALVLFFIFEVLLGELRGDIGGFRKWCLGILGVLAFRAFFSF